MATCRAEHQSFAKFDCGRRQSVLAHCPIIHYVVRYAAKPGKGNLAVDTGFGVDGGLKKNQVKSEMDGYDATFDRKDLKERANYAQQVVCVFSRII